jgi:hypothetical protein
MKRPSRSLGFALSAVAQVAKPVGQKRQIMSALGGLCVAPMEEPDRQSRARFSPGLATADETKSCFTSVKPANTIVFG